MTDKERLTLYRSIKSGNLPDKQRLETYRALKENREDVSDLITSFAFADKDRNKSLSDLMSEKKSEDQDANFDYATGGDSGLRARLSFGETDEEKEAILQSLVGEEGYTKDSKGQLALTELGQK